LTIASLKINHSYCYCWNFCLRTWTKNSSWQIFIGKGLLLWTLEPLRLVQVPGHYFFINPDFGLFWPLASG